MKIDEQTAILILVISSLIFLIGAIYFLTAWRRAAQRKRVRDNRITFTDPFGDTRFGQHKNKSHN